MWVILWWRTAPSNPRSSGPRCPPVVSVSRRPARPASRSAVALPCAAARAPPRPGAPLCTGPFENKGDSSSTTRPGAHTAGPAPVRPAPARTTPPRRLFPNLASPACLSSLDPAPAPNNAVLSQRPQAWCPSYSGEGGGAGRRRPARVPARFTPCRVRRGQCAAVSGAEAPRPEAHRQREHAAPAASRSRSHRRRAGCRHRRRRHASHHQRLSHRGNSSVTLRPAGSRGLGGPAS